MTRLTLAFAALLISANVIAQPGSPKTLQPQTYQTADVDGTGNLRIVTLDGKTITLKPDGELRQFGKQTTFEKVAISPDRHAVGALENYKTVGVSYDVSHRLLIYINGRIHRFVGVSLPGEGIPILSWHFVDGHRRVAFGQSLLHGVCEEDWELWDIDPGRFVAGASKKGSCRDGDEESEVPRWVQGAISGL